MHSTCALLYTGSRSPLCAFLCSEKTTPQQHSEWGWKVLIAEANECVPEVNGRACSALLDTGTQTSSISQFYKTHLSECVVHPVDLL